APFTAAMLARRAQLQASQLKADLAASAVELLQASADLIAFDAASRRRASLRDIDGRVTATTRKSAAKRGLGTGIATLGVGLTSLVCLTFGIVAVHAGTIPGPALTVLALTPLATAELVAGLPEAAQRLLGAGDSARRLAALDAIATPQSEPASPATVPDGENLAADALSVRWPGAADEAVRELDLEVGRARTIALTGPSGAGKSTAIAALMRYLDPASGRVLLDGTDARQLTSDSVRDRIAWCGP